LLIRLKIVNFFYLPYFQSRFISCINKHIYIYIHTEAGTVANWVVKISECISKVSILIACHHFDILRSFLVFFISFRKYGDIYTQVKTAFQIIVHNICLSYIIHTEWKYSFIKLINIRFKYKGWFLLFWIDVASRCCVTLLCEQTAAQCRFFTRAPLLVNCNF
jgi:hypothetical protein